MCLGDLLQTDNPLLHPEILLIPAAYLSVVSPSVCALVNNLEVWLMICGRLDLKPWANFFCKSVLPSSIQLFFFKSLVYISLLCMFVWYNIKTPTPICYQHLFCSCWSGWYTRIYECFLVSEAYIQIYRHIPLFELSNTTYVSSRLSYAFWSLNNMTVFRRSVRDASHLLNHIVQNTITINCYYKNTTQSSAWRLFR